VISHLRGRLLSLTPGLAVVDVHGVGYAVSLPLPTYYEVQKQPAGAEVSFFIHTHVREDALALYGFWTERERALFERLITVSGVGPRLARAILSGLPPEVLLAALAAGDVARLTRIPGVGKKTAERLVLELKDKLIAAPGPGVPAAPPARPAQTGANAELLHQALTRMGFKAAEAERAVGALGGRVETEALGDLIRDALALLSSR